jgi:hypothetical protein
MTDNPLLLFIFIKGFMMNTLTMEHHINSPWLCSVTRPVSETVPDGNEFVLARLIRTELLLIRRHLRMKGASPVSRPILGIDIAKQRVEVALLIDAKVRNKAIFVDQRSSFVITPDKPRRECNSSL